MSFPKVTIDDNGIRPAGKPDQCFYCGSKVGEEHKKDCVIVNKQVKLKATIFFETLVPHSWNEDSIHFKFNDGTWCTDNIISYLEEYVDYLKKNEKGCLCHDNNWANIIEYVETTNPEPTTKESICSE